jgi:protein pelota
VCSAGLSLCACGRRCTSENPHIELGAFHTLSLHPGMPITLTKTCWDCLDVERLQEASDPAAGADLAVVLITDGLAHVCLIGRSATLLRAKVRNVRHCGLHL